MLFLIIILDYLIQYVDKNIFGNVDQNIFGNVDRKESVT